MRPVSRRVIAAGAAVAIVAAAAAVRPGEPPRHTFRLVLGLRDERPADWSGRVEVRGGEVAELTGWRFEGGDVVAGQAWKCRTRLNIAPGARYSVTPASGKPPAAPQAPWPVGVTLTVRGEEPLVRLVLTHGPVEFRPADVPLGEPKAFLDGRVRVERLPRTAALRPPAPLPVEGARQDDDPALWVRYKTGKHYLAWISYHRASDRVLLAERDGPDSPWGEPVEVAGPGDHYRVALAGAHGGTLWVVWASQRAGNWDLFGRTYRDGQVGPEVRLTDHPGPDITHRMTTDHQGRAWLVWQGFRDGRSRIFARCADGAGWHEPVQVSASSANDWEPTVTADPTTDRVWVGWDTYETGSYGVRIRPVAGGPRPHLGDVARLGDPSLFNAHVSLACDRSGRLWAAWDEAGPQWGKDTGYLYPDSPATGLYGSRRVRVRCLADGAWREPAADWEAALPPAMREFNELPQLQDDSDGRMWMAFRHRTCRHPRADGWAVQGRWDTYATACLGDRWLPPVELPDSGGRLDMRASSQRDRAGSVYFAYGTDHRDWRLPGMPPRNLSVQVSQLGGAARPTPPRFAAQPAAAPAPATRPVHPREAEQVARVRAYRVEATGKSYRIYRGDLHRHTDLSVDGVGDGSLADLHRYAMDAAALDFVLVSDHNMGEDNEYCWWRTQQANDLYSVPGSFLSMYGYERSVPYPNGHRNVIWVNRGHRALPVPLRANRAQMAADTGKLYAYLRRTGGICTPHTSATDQGTDWSEHDGALEPFVELFQGYHTSYEAPGAPKAESDRTDLVHGPYMPDGFISRALAKGYRLGFQASSDHISTHVSYACVLAEEFSRKGLVDGMRKRHTYAATDNIVLDVRAGALGIMGDEVRTSKPALDVVVIGTGALDRVEVLRNGEVVATERPGRTPAEARFHWADPHPAGGEQASYYYVRVVQRDGQMAWSSPIWVHGSP